MLSTANWHNIYNLFVRSATLKNLKEMPLIINSLRNQLDRLGFLLIYFPNLQNLIYIMHIIRYCKPTFGHKNVPKKISAWITQCNIIRRGQASHLRRWPPALKGRRDCVTTGCWNWPSSIQIIESTQCHVLHFVTDLQFSLACFASCYFVHPPTNAVWWLVIRIS